MVGRIMPNFLFRQRNVEYSYGYCRKEGLYVCLMKLNTKSNIPSISDDAKNQGQLFRFTHEFQRK